MNLIWNYFLLVLPIQNLISLQNYDFNMGILIYLHKIYFLDFIQTKFIIFFSEKVNQIENFYLKYVVLDMNKVYYFSNMQFHA